MNEGDQTEGAALRNKETVDFVQHFSNACLYHIAAVG